MMVGISAVFAENTLGATTVATAPVTAVAKKFLRV
jgi:hypothetical protein